MTQICLVIFPFLLVSEEIWPGFFAPQSFGGFLQETRSKKLVVSLPVASPFKLGLILAQDIFLLSVFDALPRRTRIH